ncbi:MAG: DNA mismatch repair endonuclease MutL, partial [Acidobacteriota bacterium]
MPRIHILPEREFKRIAAGEVVERPASVARELVENSLDAGADRIEIRLEKGGLELLEVADDGAGMEHDDALLALEPHATSKITRLEDLSALSTLGFRGEALPSIAAVSRLEMLTSPTTGEPATRILAEPGVQHRVEPAARPRGTTVRVKDLFFNTPARRKFLRSAGTEFSRVSDLLLPEMLAHPQVAFKVRHGVREAVAAPAADDLTARIASLWGPGLAHALVPFRQAAADLKVHGFISPPEENRSSRRNWYLFVNGRPVKDRLLVHAAGSALEGALPKGRHPVLFLFLEAPPEQVDFNVHPAKSEVRFTESRPIHTLVTAALRQATRPAFFLLQGPSPGDPRAGRPVPAARSIRDQKASYGSPAGAGFPVPATGEEKQGEASSPGTGEPLTPRLPSSTTRVLSVLAQYRRCFIIAHDEDSLYLLDQHAAHERVLYEQLRGRLQQASVSSQALLFAQTLEVQKGRGEHLVPGLPWLKRAGFEIERFGSDTFVVRAVPDSLPVEGVEETVRDLLEDLVADALP